MTSSSGLTDSVDRRLRLLEQDKLCDQFEALCKSQRAPDLAAFLAEHESQLDRESIEELIRLDLAYRVDAGQRPSATEYTESLGKFAAIAQPVLGELDQENLQDGSPAHSELHELSDGCYYEVGELLGEGGMARVFRAVDRRLNRDVAFKMLRGDLLESAPAVRRFAQEAQTVARIQDDGIVRVYDVGIRDGQLFIAFELAAGGNLDERIDGRPQCPRQSAETVLALSKAIAKAHKAGVIHRDLKPSNVLLAEEGRPKVSDFGLALLRDDDTNVKETRFGDLVGTASYMAPEQALGRRDQIDERTDVYGLGGILYEMLTGRPAFQSGSSWSTVQQIIQQEPTSPRLIQHGVPADLATVCLKALSKRSQDRYQTASDLADDLRRFLDNRPILARPIGPVGRLARWCRRNPAISATIALATASVLAIAALALGNVLRERDRFREQRDAAVAHLYDSLISDAESIRLARQTGYRARAWSKIEQALQLDTPKIDRLSLRDEAVASLGGGAMGEEPLVWPKQQPNSMYVATALHPNSRLVAFGLFDHDVLIRRLDDGSKIARLTGHSAPVLEAEFSPDGNYLATADDTGEIRLWQRKGTETWELDTVLVTTASLRPGYVKAVSLAFTPDSQFLFSCPVGAVAIERWRIADRSKKTVHEESDGILRFALGPAGQRIAFVTRKQRAVLFDLESRTVLRQFPIAPHQPLDVAFRPGGRMIAVGTSSGAQLFDVENEAEVASILGDHLITLSFSPDGRTLALPAEDRKVVRLWDIDANRESALLEPGGYEALFTEDNSTLVSVSAGEVRVWGPPQIQVASNMAPHSSEVAGLALMNDGESLWSIDELGSGKNQNLATALEVPTRKFSPRTRPAVHAAGGLVALADDSQIEVYRWPLAVHAKPIAHWNHGLGAAILDLCFAPDGKALAGAGSRGVKVWTSSTGAKKSWKDPRERVLSREPAGGVCISSDAKLVGWVDFGTHVHIWDRALNEELERPKLTATYPDGAAFLPGTHQLLVIEMRGNTTLWDVDRGQPAVILEETPLDEGDPWKRTRLVVDRTGRRLCRQHGTELSIWKTDGFERLVTLPKTDGLASALHWNHDGTKLAVGLANGGMTVWDLKEINRQLEALGLHWSD